MSSRRWTVLLIRRGATKSHSVELGQWRVALLAALALLLVAVVFVATGRVWQAWVDRGRQEAMEAEIARLAADNQQIGQFAERIAELEEAYARFRAVMGADAARSERDVLLPGLAPASGDGPQLVDTREDRSGSGVWPLVEPGFVTRAFGDTVTAPAGAHGGIDIAVPTGSYVRAVHAGVVTEAADDRVYGRFVRIAHADGLISVYAHNSWLFVSPGDTVEKAEVIALSGNTGRSTAPHLHLEVEREGVAVDPLGVVGESR